MLKKSKNIFSLSALSLIATNLVPLFGIIFWAWDAFSIIILYWLETLVVGFFNILKIQKIENKTFSAYIAFFIVQYTFFLLAYLFLILNIFKPNLGVSTEYLEALKITFGYFYTLLISLVLIFISHGISFQYNFVKNKEFLTTNKTKQILAPYKRMFIMHMVIILTAKSITYYGYDQLFLAVVFLVVLKIVIDLISHIFEHKK